MAIFAGIAISAFLNLLAWIFSGAINPINPCVKYPLNYDAIRAHYLGKCCNQFGFYQSITHRSKDDNDGKFWQRYADIARGFLPHSPIFLQLVPNIDRIPDSSLGNAYARELHGMAVFLEHRYFGGSMPYGPSSNNSEWLKELTLENVLADAKSMVLMMRKKHPNRLLSPVIATGSGYEGLIAMALRQMYPDVFFAAIANAPPILSYNLNPKPDNKEQFLYRNAVSAAWRRRSPYAASQITRSIEWIGQQVNSSMKRFLPLYDLPLTISDATNLKSVAKELNLCTQPRLNSQEDMEKLQRFTESNYIAAAEAEHFLKDAKSSELMDSTVEDLMRVKNDSAFGYGNLLRRLEERMKILRLPGPEQSCMPWAGFNESQIQDEEDRKALRTNRYISCTYLPLCTANAEEGSIFLPQTKGCQDEYDECMKEFDGKAVPVTQNDLWRRFKLGPEDLANSSRIIISIDKTDPVRALLGPWPRRGKRWNSCDYSRRIEYDLKDRKEKVVRPQVVLPSDDSLRYPDMWVHEEVLVMKTWLRHCLEGNYTKGLPTPGSFRRWEEDGLRKLEGLIEKYGDTYPKTEGNAVPAPTDVADAVHETSAVPQASGS
ncbi:hypothetical protein CP533_4285 [Ophiocordyceps camponoti-saundersi (nom. inval.)]|nr:hypothetical protein CP533_4285 [Ophiocordyceps camponoti-saundersi (nom. inval.)]